MIKKLIKPLIFFIAGGLVYVYFDLYAPYCAKHECCASSGGWWMLLPNLSAILIIIGFMIIILDVLGNQPDDKNTEYSLADGTTVRPKKDLDKETLESIFKKFLSKDNTKLVPLTPREVSFLTIINVLYEKGYKTTDIMRMVLDEDKD